MPLVSEHPEMMFIGFLLTFFLYYLIDRIGKKRCKLTNWPLVGMLPGEIQNLNGIHEKITEIFFLIGKVSLRHGPYLGIRANRGGRAERCQPDPYPTNPSGDLAKLESSGSRTLHLLKARGGTFWFRGPWFCNMDLLITCHPDDIQHICSKNFPNYPKGSEFREKFDILGNGILTTDYEMWQIHRRSVLAGMSGANFYNTLERIVWQKMETGLIPVLDRLCETGVEVDLQDIFQRFGFDNICQLLLNADPGSLSLDLPTIPCQRAFCNYLGPIFQRHLLPRIMWKLKGLLRIGSEKLLMDCWITSDNFINSFLENDNFKDLDILAVFRKAYEGSKDVTAEESRKFMRDTVFGLLFAGSDTMSTTLTWFFWLLSNHPSVESKILVELEAVLNLKEGEKWRSFTVEESQKLVYLHAALSETLRLFPPVALEYRSPIQADKLPSGHHIRPNTRVVLSFYSVGRMESLWGKDCLEFKPERWIARKGSLVNEPSYKFPAFNVGPRSCTGKEMAFIDMKMVAATLIYHYNIHVVKEQQISPKDSIIIHAKNGLRVGLSKKERK